MIVHVTLKHSNPFEEGCPLTLALGVARITATQIVVEYAAVSKGPEPLPKMPMRFRKSNGRIIPWSVEALLKGWKLCKC